MTYNKSEIMKRAWEIFNAGQAVEQIHLNGIEAIRAKNDGTAWRVYKVGGSTKAIIQKNTFSQALKMAWAEAKRAVAQAKRDSMTELEKLEEALFILNMKDHHSFEDRQEVSRLEAAIKRIKNTIPVTPEITKLSKAA